MYTLKNSVSKQYGPMSKEKIKTYNVYEKVYTLLSNKGILFWWDTKKFWDERNWLNEQESEWTKKETGARKKKKKNGKILVMSQTVTWPRII